MRTAFIETLVDIAERDERVWLVCGDLGFSVLERFADRFPDRFVNAGVAEQNMTGVAAGLALSGCCVYTYSIANFATLRCLEQLRNDVAYHRLPVTVVSVGGGLTYGTAGYTHHAVEDLGVMRAIHGFTVLAPGDPFEAMAATRLSHEVGAPCYLRLEKGGSQILHSCEPSLSLGKPLVIRDGSDVSLIATGGILATAFEAAVILDEQGLSAQVVSIPCLQPLDLDTLREMTSLGETGGICVVEEHLPVGGLRDALASYLAEARASGRWVAWHGLDGDLLQMVGSQADLLSAHGLTAENIAATVARRASHT